MKKFINKRKIVILLLVIVSATSFYYVYNKVKINRPISAKLVFNEILDDVL
ncbi:hypothetical protein [Maledivibacter halophilus]|uniref:Uncharacterized protein n=1 Tax=Maledivibacter halophilus TaxID=36842 RepID=A0A1T5MUB7_9FIRM|nr:hypothetical protein [Maledivibacter halophilus]SKC91478.1 hypothetical protein SAMN02194393_05324 [Maledivibacter halophilus]